MKRISLLGYSILLGAIAISSPTIAETPETPPTFQPRIGVRYTTEGAGFDSFGSLEGFLPIFQQPGNSLTFLEGKLLLDNNSTVASNILLGHRFYNGKDNRVVGGYLSYSTRDTGNSNFDQLGLGFEALGNWDFRFNAYLPLRSSASLLSQTTLDSASSFQGNSLVIGRQRLFEVALSGVDAEVGTRLTRLGAGELRGYAGIYYYSGGDSREAFGWKTRLVANPIDYVNLGLSLQQDNLFDTRLVFTIGANFPSGISRKNKPKKDSALLRMADLVERQNTILVTNELRNNTVVVTGSDGQPLTFIHVINGGTGNGTFESPFGEVTSAVGVAQSNNIVYVRSDATTTFSPFTIPNGVQVLSSGPIQRVNTSELGLVTLPFSGSGIHPIISGSVPEGNGLVTLGSDTVLSGFNIQVSGEQGARGISGVNINNTSILNNTITNPFGEGIALENATGNVEIASNTVTSSGFAGILLDTFNGTTTIINNSINNSEGQGIKLTDINGTTAIDNNKITNSGDEGILLGNVEGTTTISNNTIDSSSEEGIDLEIVSGTTTIINNSINNSEGQGIKLTDINGTTAIDNNKITNSGDEGILLGNVEGTTTISNNTIDSPSDKGIDLDTVSGTTTISNNSINNSEDQGIELTDINGTTTIDNNKITNSGDDGINISEVQGTVSINQNTVTGNNSNTGIVANNTTGNVNLTISNNILSQNFNDVRVNFEGTATGTLEISGNNINNAGTAVDVQLSNSANFSSITINNNQINGVDADVTSSGINLQAFDNVAAGNVAISGNTINTITNGDGINIQVNNNTQITLTISGNTISNVRDFDAGDFNFTDGINIEAFDDANSTFTISNNGISQINGNGITVSSFNNANSTINLLNNVISQISYGEAAISISTFDDATTNINVQNNQFSYSEPE